MKLVDMLLIFLVFFVVSIIGYRIYWNHTPEGLKANARVDRAIGCALAALNEVDCNK